MIWPYDTNTKPKYILGIILTFSFVLNFKFALADAAADQLAASQQKLVKLDQQVRAYQQQIASTQSQSSSLRNEVTIYNDQIVSTQIEIEAKQTEIDDANLQITQLQNLIDQKTQDIADNKQILGQLIVDLNEDDDRYALDTSIGSGNLSDFLDQVQYTQSLNDKISLLVQKIVDLKTQLIQEQKTLQTQVAQLQELQNELQITQTSVTSIRDQKQQLLNATQGSEKNFQKLLAVSQNEETNLEKEVEDLDNKVKGKLGSKTLTIGQGLLAWPINGIITQGYGKTGFTALGYDFHNGIDIAGPPGQPIYAAADGDVIGTDQSNQDFGNWVALQSLITTATGPEEIVTLYGHMESFKVTMGQRLLQGDLIGYEGNTGNTTAKLYGPERGYHLHFGVYDSDGFGITEGAYTKIYGPYKVPYGNTYNPLDFLTAN